jgi:hypothetical protein
MSVLLNLAFLIVILQVWRNNNQAETPKKTVLNAEWPHQIPKFRNPPPPPAKRVIKEGQQPILPKSQEVNNNWKGHTDR